MRRLVCSGFVSWCFSSQWRAALCHESQVKATLNLLLLRSQMNEKGVPM